MDRGDLKISENTVVHCPTEELAKKVLEIVFGLGYEWKFKPSKMNILCWELYRNQTCYDLHRMQFGSLDEYDADYTIISAEDFIKLHTNNDVKEEQNVSECKPISLDVAEEDIESKDSTTVIYIEPKEVLQSEKGDLKISENTGVNCTTIYLADKVLKIAHNLGYKWNYGGSYLDDNGWGMCRENTYYNLAEGYLTEKENCDNVITAEEFLELHGVELNNDIHYLIDNLKTMSYSTEDSDLRSEINILLSKFNGWGNRLLKKENKEPILQEAQRILGGDRQADYGDAVDNFQRISDVVNASLRRTDITPDICCMVHLATKLCREGNKHKRDNCVDFAAYASILNDINDRKNEKN